MTQNRRLAHLLLLCAAACGGPEEGFDAPEEELANDESAIVNGTTTRARPEVGFLFTSGGGCTATLISSRDFVTAAHCVNYAPQLRGGTFTIDGQPSIGVERVFSQGGQVGADDIAVGRLSSAAPWWVRAAAVSDTEPEYEWLTVMGYGCTNRSTGAGAGVKRYTEYWFNGNNSSYLCPGDSGGPVFHGAIDANGSIVRINSGYNTGTGADIGADAVRFRTHINALATALETNGISYRGHVQNYGWRPASINGAIAGTTGQSLRLEGLQVWSARPGVNVCYRAHVSGIGWQGEVCDGNLAGTVGQSRSIEAVTIRLASRPAGTNGVEYNAYLQNLGWQGWKRDGQLAGTVGQNRRMEAIMIRLY